MKADLTLHGTAPRFDRIRQEPALRIPEHMFLVLLCAGMFMVTEFIVRLFSQLAAAITVNIAGIKLSYDAGMTLTLFLTSVDVLLVLIFCRCIERRRFRTMGLTKRRLPVDYPAGLLIGFAMFSAVLLLIWTGGAAEREAVAQKPAAASAVLLFAGWMIQGFSEELTFRGYLMMTIGTRVSPWKATLYSAVCFACAHLGNSGVSLPALLNLTLFGIFMSLVVLRTDSIWCAAAIHTIWNWAQGSFYGLQVSGMDSGSSFFRFTLNGTRSWLGGGAFGPEGGIAATAVLLLCIVIVLLLPNRCGQRATPA